MRVYKSRHLHIVLTAAVICLLVGVTAAIAETLEAKNYEHRLYGVSPPNVSELAEGASATASQAGTGILKIPAKSAEIRCSSLATSEGQLHNVYGEAKPGGAAQATLTYSSCKVFEESTGTELKACTKAFEESNPAGVTSKVTALAIQHEGKIYLVIEPLSGEVFATVKFGGTCPLPEKAEVRGSLAIEISSEELVSQELNADTANAAEGLKGGKKVQELLGAKLKYGASEAFAKGVVSASLSGEHAGKKWGALLQEEAKKEPSKLTSTGYTHILYGVSPPNVSELAEGASATASQAGTGILKIPAKSAEIRCSSLATSEGQLHNVYGEAKPGGAAQATLTYSSCKVFEESTGTELKACTKAFEESNPAGVTSKVTALAIQHEGKIYLVIEPLSGEVFATVKFGGTCPLPEKAEVRGSLAIEISSEELVSQELNADTANAAEGLKGGKKVQELLGAKLKYGASEAFAKGVVSASLSGEHAGKKWGALLQEEAKKEPSKLTSTGYTHILYGVSPPNVSELAEGASATASQAGTGILKIPAKSAEIRCSSLATSEGQLHNVYGEAKPGGAAQATLTYSSCKVFEESTGTELKACTKAFEESNPAGVTSKVTALAIQHEGKIYLVIEPLSGEVFATVKFGGTCPLPEKAEVRGSLAIEISSEELVSQELNADTANAAEGLKGGKKVQELLGAKLKYGASEAFAKGVVSASLSGEHAGKKWGVS